MIINKKRDTEKGNQKFKKGQAQLDYQNFSDIFNYFINKSSKAHKQNFKLALSLTT